MPTQTQTLVSPTTSSTSQSTTRLDTGDYLYVNVCADALATTETVAVYILCGETMKALTDLTGTAIQLTATIPAVQLAGGSIYGFLKSTTAGACGVYWSPAARQV